jgi:hypothetical protein
MTLGTWRPDRQFDTHGDSSGEVARKIMSPITPMLATFLDRVMALPDQNVVTMLVGEWSRTNPESDHEPGGTATVIGKYIKTGTAGPQNADGSAPANAPHRPKGFGLTPRPLCALTRPHSDAIRIPS